MEKVFLTLQDKEQGKRTGFNQIASKCKERIHCSDGLCGNIICWLNYDNMNTVRDANENLPDVGQIVI